MRIAIVSIGHPEYEFGGADRAAYSLFQKLKAEPGIEATFIARVDESRIGHDGRISAYHGRPDEILWRTPPMDYFMLSSADNTQLMRDAREIFGRIKPDIVHFGHFLHIGADLFDYVTDELQVPSVLTFNEYVPVCCNDGQMITTELQLCYEASAAECARCFPTISSGKFFLRKEYLQTQFAKVSRFLAPSPFVKERYTAWGLEAEKFSTIGYIQSPSFETLEPVADQQSPSFGGDKTRFGFFGRINPYKGVDLLLRAVENLEPDIRDSMEVLIFGANLDDEADGFQKIIKDLLDANDDVVSLLGSYLNENTIALMRGVDWLIIPSIWWEVGPIVIEESKIAGTPILCSDIAGMFEKVTPGVTGAHFKVGSEFDLAAKITQIVSGRLQVEFEPTDVKALNKERFGAHMEMYRELLG